METLQKWRPGDDHTNFWKAPSRFRWRRPGPRQFTKKAVFWKHFIHIPRPRTSIGVEVAILSQITRLQSASSHSSLWMPLKNKLWLTSGAFPCKNLQQDSSIKDIAESQEEILRPLANAGASDPNNRDLKGHITVQIPSCTQGSPTFKDPQLSVPKLLPGKAPQESRKECNQSSYPLVGYLKSPNDVLNFTPRKVGFPTLFNVQGISWLESAIRVSQHNR